ncbi:superoxide dismutase [Flavobacterium sp. GA093]|uniref:Superoxide dismutase n=1 Tax=Flavobacterium hydrocarbonoxydans TaxID=2683249 RepID=A0A6I4NLD4_9FLAO|nr:superoxide dismutase [Flavobacterium hydrocarbonoxydans]MWB94863.1 superoxide dismutase [Flavobacterium hydrocarbonoxydans]
MKNKFTLFPVIASFILLFSCNEKKLTEVVEVPLPTKEEKIIIGSPNDVKAEPGSFELTKLPFAYDALAPAIRSLTLETHYSKHYLSYTNNLNKEIVTTAFENSPIEDILKNLDLNNARLRQNAGGYYNHTLYFNILTPKEQTPKDTLAGSINAEFGSFDNLTKQFKNEANKQFGSGWVWLVVDKTGKLQVSTTENQDNPLMKNALIKGTPILGIDLWEHAYYLDYQNRKKSYIDAFYKLINWEKVNENYKTALTKVRKV